MYTAWSVTAGEIVSSTKWNLLGANDASFRTGVGFAWGSSAVLTGGPSAATWAAAWTSTGGTAPAIVNGTMVSKYMQIAKAAILFFKLTFGSSSTYGTGGYRISLPVTADSSLPIGVPIGLCHFNDTGSQAYYGRIQCMSSTTMGFDAQKITATPGTVLAHQDAGGAGGTSPFTLGSGDFIMGTATYPVA